MKKIVAVLVSSLMFSSCFDYLDKKPLDLISDNDVWNDEALVESYLSNLYYQMAYFANESYGDGWDGDVFFPVFAINHVSDECMSQWRDWGDALRWYNYKFGNLKIQGGLLEWWGYEPIRRINVFIEELPKSPLSDDLNKVRTAEARFLRAFSYFAMVKRYGGVPLITVAQSIEEPEDELYPARDREEVLYDFVISEIEDIVNDLPETIDNSNLGRPSRYAALALKCRAALYAGSIARFGKVQLDGVVGIPAEKADYYYQIAYDAGEKIITGGKHQLYNVDEDKATNFRNLFLVKNNSEVIFAKRHDNINGDAGGNGWCVDFFQCPRPQGWNRGNLDGAYLELVEEFEYADGRSGKLDREAIQQGLWTTEELWKDKDPRFFATFYTQNTPWKGGKVEYYKGILLPDGTIQTTDSYDGILAAGDQDVDGTCFGVLKYLDESHDNMAGTNSAWSTSAQDWLIFRLAEVYLNMAEAAFETGNTDNALMAINKVRERAGISLLTSINREKIRQERKVELAFEGHRYWDVRRWRTAVDDLSREFSGLRYVLDYNSYKAGELKYKLIVIAEIDGAVNVPLFREENYYLPITLSRTANNPRLVENPGYR
ncbi:MAG: RagB/SusD family nutrient uptake outer membrane protein, partial [Tannerella sp.]|nr:RagB/SusD family nutrient uptake outer membrane protein [Tannerella sp.]